MHAVLVSTGYALLTTTLGLATLALSPELPVPSAPPAASTLAKSCVAGFGMVLVVGDDQACPEGTKVKPKPYVG